MPDYRLTSDAEVDLLQIAIYTIETWGVAKADRYEASIVQCFAAIALGDSMTTSPTSSSTGIEGDSV